MLFCLRKIAVYFQNFFYARSNRLFQESQQGACALLSLYRAENKLDRRVQNSRSRQTAKNALRGFINIFPHRPDRNKKRRYRTRPSYTNRFLTNIEQCKCTHFFDRLAITAYTRKNADPTCRCVRRAAFAPKH